MKAVVTLDMEQVEFITNGLDGLIEAHRSYLKQTDDQTMMVDTGMTRAEVSVELDRMEALKTDMDATFMTMASFNGPEWPTIDIDVHMTPAPVVS